MCTSIAREQFRCSSAWSRIVATRELSADLLATNSFHPRYVFQQETAVVNTDTGPRQQNTAVTTAYELLSKLANSTRDERLLPAHGKSLYYTHVLGLRTIKPVTKCYRSKSA